MDGTLNDFFNEIDQIAPPKEKNNEPEWQECYDSGTGYSYYWNTKTDEVTWEMPKEYKLWKEKNLLNKSTYLPTATKNSPGAPITTTKIYKIQEDSVLPNKIIDESKKSVSEFDNKPTNKDTDAVNIKEEKVVTISSFNKEAESKTEDDDTRVVSIVNSETTISALPTTIVHSNSNSASNSEDEDIDLLTQIHNRAKVLKDLGGELPPDVKKLVDKNNIENKKEFHKKVKKKEIKDVTGFSLLATYGDSEEEEEEEKTVSSVITTVIKENRTSHSTLFPIPEPIDIKQFNTNESEPSELINSKAFHRKRRIGIDFDTKKSKTELEVPNNTDVSRQGLGFKSEQETDPAASKTKIKLNYSEFKSGGLMFATSEVIKPVVESDKEQLENKEDESVSDKMVTIEETHKTLNEKLTFLSEGREPASPVQVMIIQMETLYEAMKVGSLTVNYLYKWLKETCSELVKLEKDAAPSGWLLQWDRTNKRYYYRNQQTGVSQWDYPHSDVVGVDEAMDISTTPPPPPVSDVPLGNVSSTIPLSFLLEPPPPPQIKSPEPPPPPIISKDVKKKQNKVVKLDSNSPLSPNIQPIVCPLPGEKDSHVEISSVNSSETSLPLQQIEQLSKEDDLGSALDSFYCDIAALETKSTAVPENTTIPHAAEIPSAIVSPEVIVKKKKKNKVKLVQGLAMKKKGVSKLVEKWNNVQKNYN